MAAETGTKPEEHNGEVGSPNQSNEGYESGTASKPPRKRKTANSKQPSTPSKAASSDQSPEETQENTPNPVLITPQPPVVKRSHHKKKTPKADVNELAGYIAQLIIAMFSMIATKAGDYWQVGYEESMKVALPAARILDRLDLSGKVSAYSDYAALIVALFGIIAPRIFMLNQLKKTPAKEEVVNAQTTTDPNSNPARPTNENTGAGNAIADLIDSIIPV